MRITKVRHLVKAKNLYTLILISILIFSFFITFFHLKKRNLLDWDEAYYLSIVKTWRAGTDWFVYKIFRPREIMQFGFSDYILEYGGAINTFAKDGFLAIVFLFSYFFGLHEITILWVSAIFGVLTVWIIYMIGKVSLGRIAGLLSCSILAVSVFHLHYSRSGFSQSTSAFFLYLAVLLYIFSYQRRNDIKASRKFLFFSGMSLGYAFTCHYNLIWALPTFLVLEIAAKALYEQKMSFRDSIKHTLLLFMGVSIPILFFGGLSELVKFILYLNPSLREAIRGSLGIGTFVSYFDRILNFLTPSVSVATSKGNSVYSTSQLGSLFYYVKLLLLWEGPLILTLLLTGVVRLIYRQIRHHIFIESIILTLFLVPFFYWSFHSWQLSRSFVSAIPAVALIIGGLLAQVIEKYCKSEAAKTTTVFIILLAFIFNTDGRLTKELSYESGYPSAIRFMQEHSGVKHLSSQFTISRFFVGRKNALDISTYFDNTDVGAKLKELYNKQGYKYLLLDQIRYLFEDSPIVKAADKSLPVFATPHSTTANLFENNVVGFADKACHAPKVLMVYDLSDIINNLEEGKAKSKR